MTKRRRSARLAAISKKAKTEENKKKRAVSIKKAAERESKEEEEPFPLEQLGLVMMSCVLEKLRVDETMTMMATSKSMVSFYESEAKFKIPFEYMDLKVDTWANGYISVIHNSHYPLVSRSATIFLGDLQNLPFRFYVKSLILYHGITPAMGEELKDRLAVLKIEFICSAYLSAMNPEEIDILERSLGNATIRDQIRFLGVDPSFSSLNIPFILRHPLSIGSAKGSLREHMRIIQNSKLRFEMSKERSEGELESAVETVIQKWSNSPSSLEKWELDFDDCKRKKRMMTYEAFAKALDAREPFEFNTREALPNHRPLFFVRKDEKHKYNHYYIARDDGSVVHVYANVYDPVILEVIPRVEGPPILSI